MAEKHKVIREHSTGIYGYFTGLIPESLAFFLVLWLILIVLAYVFLAFFSWKLLDSILPNIDVLPPSLFFFGLLAYCVWLVYNDKAKIDVLSAGVGFTGSSKGIFKSFLLESLSLLLLLFLLVVIMLLQQFGLL